MSSSTHVTLEPAPSREAILNNAQFLCVIVNRGSYRGIFVMRDQVISFTEKRDFKKIFFVIRTHMFCVTREELQLRPDIRDFNASFASV